MRGYREPGDPRVVGSVVGMLGGSAFVLVNRVALPSGWSVTALVLWLVVLAAAALAVLVLEREPGPAPRPRPRAGLVYGGSVTAMVLAIVLGSRVLTGAGRPELVPALVVVAVGLHFVPFAAAFRARVFGRLGWAMAALGSVGLLLGWSGAAEAPSAAAVTAGLAMIGLVGLDARDRPRSPARA